MNLAIERGTIVLDPAQVELDSLVEAVSRIGYGLSFQSSPASGEENGPWSSSVPRRPDW